MCGIYGAAGPVPAKLLADRVRRMGDELGHRGPDDRGSWAASGVALGMRRLAIIDVAGGHQPMANEDRTLWLVYNGEIYNHMQLRGELRRRGHRFRTHADTEVILHLYEELGEACVERLRGVFAFALWDDRRGQLLLARDRLGVKPLYLYRQHDTLYFASEAKAFWTIPQVRPAVDREALHYFLTFRYVPAPRTLFQGVEKLLPGHTLTVRQGRETLREYWDLPMGGETETADETEYAERLRELLEEAVRLRLMSEVPLGLFLSGGLDSSSLLALMERSGMDRIATFSVGFAGAGGGDHPDYGEFGQARFVAEQFPTAHRELLVHPAQVAGSLPSMIWHLDEPLADPTVVPLDFVCRLAREQVTVALSGEGADEILAGYEIYREPSAVQNFLRLPPFVRQRIIAPLLGALPEGVRGRNFLWRASRPLPERYFGVGFLFPEAEKDKLYAPPFRREDDNWDPCSLTHPYYQRVRHADPVNQMLYFDTKVWLPEDTLLKADKISMAHSLELRVPMLDHRVVEFAARLPSHLKLKGSTGKYLLRLAMRGVLPERVLRRPKIGFPTPMSRWLSREFRSLAQELLLGEQALDRGYFAPEALRSLLRQDPAAPGVGRRVYALMVLELWHRIFIDGESQGEMSGRLAQAAVTGV